VLRRMKWSTVRLQGIPELLEVSSVSMARRSQDICLMVLHLDCILRRCHHRVLLIWVTRRDRRVGFLWDSSSDPSLKLIWLSGSGSEEVKLSSLQLERAVVVLLQKRVLPLRQWTMSPKLI
jgi:hypothetical protein